MQGLDAVSSVVILRWRAGAGRIKTVNTQLAEPYRMGPGLPLPPGSYRSFPAEASTWPSAETDANWLPIGRVMGGFYSEERQDQDPKS